jgi:1,4-alpha-glucan branching enzyme
MPKGGFEWAQGLRHEAGDWKSSEAGSGSPCSSFGPNAAGTEEDSMAESKVRENRDRSSRRKVKLVARLPNATSVRVTGQFSQWSEYGIPLRRVSSGVWEADLELPPGEYEYRLLVDGAWHDHSEAERRVSNPFGSENCILSV